MNILKTLLLLLATTLGTVAPACTIQAGTSATLPTWSSRTRSPQSVSEETPAAAPAKSFPESGGLSPDDAWPVDPTETIEGVVKKERRYYSFQASQGQRLQFIIYSELTESSIGGANMTVRLLAADGEKLAGDMTATYANAKSPEFDKETFKFSSSVAQPILMEVSCGCATPVHYKIIATAQ